MRQNTDILSEHPRRYRMRTFLYARVSTADQTTTNQVLEVGAAGFAVESHRVISECVSGSVPSGERAGFVKLMDRLETGDVLIVTKLDRLGRNAMDVRATVEKLADMGVRVHCLALGGIDLCSPAGKMTMGVITAVAEFERDLIVERTQAGLARAKAQGTKLGRTPALTAEQRSMALKRLCDGIAVAQVAREFKASRQTIMRIRAAAV
jgi:putative DNA-invertase from lambdoid prophage Rac